MVAFFHNLLQPALQPSPVQAFAAAYPPAVSPTPKIRIVADEQGVEKSLDGLIARGGEGTIHRVAGRNDVIVKIYHPEILADHGRAKRLRNKITDMAANSALRRHARIAWPLVPLFCRLSGEWCGYGMKVRSGVSLRELCGNPHNLARTAPYWHRQHLIRLCVDFLDTIESLGNERALPVDFNPSNFLIDLNAIRMNFIDCDGYQFMGSSGMHLCEAILPEMSAPEVVRRNGWRDNPVSVASLRFSVGMTLFYILNMGNSPYRHRNGHDPVKNLITGACALGKGADCELPRGSCYRIWSHLTFKLKELFIRCFREGHGNPTARPSIAEWRDALLKYNHRILLGHADASLIPDHAKSSDYRGKSDS